MNEIDVDNLKYLYDIRANIPLIAACSLIAILLRNAVCNSCNLKRQKGREEFIKEKMNDVEAVLIGGRDGRETEVERKDQKNMRVCIYECTYVPCLLCCTCKVCSVRTLQESCCFRLNFQKSEKHSRSSSSLRRLNHDNRFLQ